MSHDVPGRAKAVSLLGSLVFFAIAPGTIAGLVPYLLTDWRVQSSTPHLPAIRIVGAVVLLAGVALLVDCFLRFALEGRGTPAPVAPTEQLVLSGTYRHVRNPIYIAVVSIIVGQAFLFGSATLIAYAALVWIAFHLFVRLYEEPALRRRFGRGYDEYVRHVPRWLPRASAWDARP
jgi:protein-S-isoprenylcysteine O-methyltransferase Ste14